MIILRYKLLDVIFFYIPDNVIINFFNFIIIQVNKISRDEVEKDLDFLGFIILENRLKETTVGVIKELTDANIRTIMITGKINDIYFRLTLIYKI